MATITNTGVLNNYTHKLANKHRNRCTNTYFPSCV